MAQCVLILGKSGSGKSASLRNFTNDELALINVNKKPLPFKGEFDSTIETADYDLIMKAIGQTKKQTIVIDDAGYLITSQFMNGHAKNVGGAIYEFYNQIADNFYKLIKFCQNRVSDDKIIYFMMQEDKNDFGEIKPKTIGRLLDEKVCLEGLFTIVLRAEMKDGKYIFHTRTDGLDVSKTPMGMFPESEIDNDLKSVNNAIRKYYNLTGKKEKEITKGEEK